MFAISLLLLFNKAPHEFKMCIICRFCANVLDMFLGEDFLVCFGFLTRCIKNSTWET